MNSFHPFLLLLALTGTLTAFADTGVRITKPACEAGSQGCFKREEIARLPLNYNVDGNGNAVVNKNGKVIPRWKALLPAETWEISYARKEAADGSTAADHMERQTRMKREDENKLLLSRGFVTRPYHPTRAVPNVKVTRSAERGARQ